MQIRLTNGCRDIDTVKSYTRYEYRSIISMKKNELYDTIQIYAIVLLCVYLQRMSESIKMLTLIYRRKHNQIS